ncbi:hypothetical protein [Acinetobacter sp. TUM15131]|uniref:hypothetical protein n=1 Tax=Acinetobacter sp. TUM15131 TaxID=2609141 RepID=UPI00124D3967|nr:hypothetical protein [Acinetobacter sp. TUM15131]
MNKSRFKIDEKVILPDSSEAAWPINVTAWQSNTGHIFLEESVARYDGSTHSLCKRGHLSPKQGYCEECVPLNNQEEYATYHTQQWQDEPLYSMALDQWYFDKNSVLELMRETGQSAQELMLVIGEPKNAYEIDPDDYFEEHLPDGISVPDEIAEAFESLNKVIRNCPNPLCYYPSTIAALIVES